MLASPPASASSRVDVIPGMASERRRAKLEEWRQLEERLEQGADRERKERDVTLSKARQIES